jgi:hypothetical protein
LTALRLYAEKSYTGFATKSNAKYISSKKKRESALDLDQKDGNNEERQYIARTIKYEKMILVNICDEELLGTTVKGVEVDMPISREYFGGDKVNETQAINLVKSSSIVNLAGTRIVSKVVESNLASGRAVKQVGNVSFLMIYKF